MDQPPQGSPADPPATRPEGIGPLGLAATGSALLLLISVFLPWVTVRVSTGLFGEAVAHGSQDASGFKADGTGMLTALMAVTVLGLVAAALSTGGPRYAAAAAVPGAVAVLCCVVFLVRLQAMKDQLTGGPITGLDVSVSPGVGWFIALLASLAVCGFAVAELMRERGLEIVRIEEPGTLDGGDVLQTADTLSVGRSARTNEEAVCKLAGLVGRRVVPVEVRGCLHLKTAMTALPDGTLIVVGQVALRIQGRPQRQVRDQHVRHHVELEPLALRGARVAERRGRHDVRPRTEAADREELLGDLLPGHQIRLGDDRHDRRLAGALQRAGDEPVAGPDGLVCRDAEADDVDLGQGGADQAVQALAEQGARPVQARRVHNDQLCVGAVHDAPDGPAGGLRPAAGDRHLGSDQGVHER